MQHFWIAMIFGLGVLIQTVSGFGVALVVMPMLVGLMTVGESVAVCTLVAQGLNVVVFARHRVEFEWRAMRPVLIPLVPGVIAGLWLAGAAPQRWVIGALGVLVTAFSVYSLTNPVLPSLHGRRWGYLCGLATGVLSGAYATSGPPLVIYAACRRWSPRRFYAHAAGVFLICGCATIVGCFVRGDYQWRLAGDIAAGLAGLAVGYGAGSVLNRRVEPRVFRLIVLVLLLVMGVRLIVRAWWL